ncbi:MAG: hypothetical protein HY423_04475 [Candidatus Lambdaproteobacteria bacterium]|nr:hypothetical protein [Candidatus Lambdaproteobacteria bacterium]
MPKYFEFVAAAYGIWVLSLTIYLGLLARKAGRLRRLLGQLNRAGGGEAGPR